MLLTKFSMEFNHEDWVDMTYPITVRVANIREKQAALEQLGLPPPFDPVVWLDDLSKYADSTWDEKTTRYVLRYYSPDAIRDEYRKYCRIVDGKKPRRGSCPSKTTFEGRLKDWQRSASFLLNLYAAAVYRDQLALIQNKEEFNTSASPKPVTRTWEFEAWDAKLKKMKAEEVAGSYAKREFDDSEMAIINRFSGRLRKNTTEANNDDGSTTQIAEEQVEIADSTATTDASGSVAESSVSNNTRHIQQRRTSAMPEGALQSQNRASGVSPHTTSATGPSTRSQLSARSASSAADSKTVESGAGGGDVRSFTDHHGRNHHRGTSGKFVKGAASMRSAISGMERSSTKGSSDVALSNADAEEGSNEDGTESSLPRTRSGVKRKISATQDGMPSQTYGLATEPTNKRAKLSQMGKSQPSQLTIASDGKTGGAESSLAVKGSGRGGKSGKGDARSKKDVVASVDGDHVLPIEANQRPTEEQSSTTTPRKRLVLKNSGPRPET